MNRFKGSILFLFAMSMLFSCQRKPVLDRCAQVFADFQNPPADMRSAPLWVWNTRVSKSDIDDQLIDFRDHGLGGVFIHPRPGLITPYLSPEWLDLCAYTVAKGKELGMKVWIYDENSYPSGFAGGHVPAEMPGSLVKSLQMTNVNKLPDRSAQKPVLVLAADADGFEDITDRWEQQDFGKGDFYLFSYKERNPSPWYGGFNYVDIMQREVTEKFIATTMEPYRAAFGEAFGNTVPGVFQDEAHIAPAGDHTCVQYTPKLFEAFSARGGYDLRLHLPSLFKDIGDWRRVRHNYYATLLELFIDNWAKPYADYCQKYHLCFTGHYWEHRWPSPDHGPDNMALSSYSHMPGIDILMNQYRTDPDAQFGNHRAVKEIRSAANQMGFKRTLSETYGAAGWDLTFRDQKRIADWEYALGVNFLNQHLSYMTIMGARKRDHPQSFSYHEPWWPAYKELADYIARLSVAMSSGRQENRILVLEPTTTAWMHYARTTDHPWMDSLGVCFQNFVNELEKRQIEYDLGCEEIMRRLAGTEGERLRVGECIYDLVILPPMTENLDSSTAELLVHYANQKGRVLSFGDPDYIDGRASDRIAQCSKEHSSTWKHVNGNSGFDLISDLQPPVLRFFDLVNPEMLFHHRRVLNDAELLLLVNISDSVAASGKITLAKTGVEQWDLFTGTAKPYPVVQAGKAHEVHFALPPAGSLLLCLRSGASNVKKTPVGRLSVIPPVDALTIRRETLNALTMDYCDLAIKSKREKDLYFYDAQRKTFQANGLKGNPWDSAVQYKTSLLDLDTFAPGSGFEADFIFMLTPGVEVASLQVVVERPHLWQVAVNNRPVASNKDAWWLDKNFGVYSIGDLCTVGKNKITLRSDRFTIHTELEPVYLRGNFSLKAEDKGFVVIPDKEMTLGSWKDQGAPFYSDGVVYSHSYEITFATNARYKICLGDWQGTFARVLVNGEQAGIIAFEPAELEINRLLRSGRNQVDVIVYGSLKNLLGPHHNEDKPGAAWPPMFQRGAAKGYPAGSAYRVLDYGLMEDFRLVRSE